MRSGLIYIGNKVYQRTTVLLDLEVLGHLQKQATKNELTFSEALNMLLLKSMKEDLKN